MERDQIIKALECCQIRYIAKHCDECSYHRWLEPTCRGVLCEDALSLIKKLTEDNERLSQSLANTKSILANCKADTVRKMQERLKDKMDMHTLDERFARIFKADVDQIAKEMMEGL